ncbi:Na+/H+ antiporter NhaC family protein [Phormidium tenue FACHB-886]|nr:Na+/H+ antiporter NhaC family protein [Phormidium tenue FACHB-886]
MDLVLTLVFSFGLLVFSTSKGYFVAYPLLTAMLLLMAMLQRRGFKLKSLLAMAIAGSRQSFSVIWILLLIGAITAVWLASGTVAALVYYGVQVIHPRLFILLAFLLTSGVSVLIGTSFGAVGTIGTALMILANGSGVDAHAIAGAIIAGAYVGDRCSPMSSSANLIATVTQTDLYGNIRNMLRTAWLPLGITCLVYLGLSVLHPVQISNSLLPQEIDRLFDLNPIVLLPAVAILLLALLRVEVKRSILFSIVLAVVIGISLQHRSLLDLLRFSMLGFQLSEPSSLDHVLVGGGVLSMAKVCLVVVVSTAFAGLFSGTQVLAGMTQWLNQANSRSSLFLGTALIGTAAAAFGCTQTIAILLAQQLVQRKYEAEQNSIDLAVDLENTVVVISPLIPWNIAGLVPATVLGTNAGFIPYAVYLYLLPLLTWLALKTKIR